MMHRFMATRILAALLVSTTTPAFAQPASTAASRATPTIVQNSADAALDERHAREWGLRPKEWARYRQLMQGPLGIYSPNLDPLTALGIEARSSEEQRHYAERQVRAEARRVEKLLAYQRAYDAAWQRLYPNKPRLTLPDAAGSSLFSVPTSTLLDTRIAVFVKDGCPACDHTVQRLQSAGTVFDIYMVGSHDDDTRIRTWARRTGIDPAKVRAHTITLNHDDGRWQSLGVPGDLPAVVHQVDGQWQRLP